MKRITYSGPLHAVEVEVAPLRFVTVERGETVELADRLAESLLEQVDNWSTARPAKSSKKETDQ